MKIKGINQWIWLHLLSLVALIFQQSSPATILGRWSTVSLVAIALFTITTPLIWVASRWLAKRLATIKPNAAQAFGTWFICGIVLFAIWFVNIGPTNSYIIVRLYITFVLFTFALWATPVLLIPSWTSRLITVIGLGSASLLLVISSVFPDLLWIDEGYMVSVVMGFIKTGHPRALLYNPLNLESFSLTYEGMGYWFNLFGVTFSSGRIFIFLLALISLLFLYFAIRCLYSSVAAWATVIIAGFAFLADNYLRTDVGVAVWLSAAFLFWAYAQRKNRLLLHLLVGFCIGFSLDGHPTAYRFSLGFGLAYMIEYGLLLRQQRRLVIYWPIAGLIIGGLLGVGAYIGLYSNLAANNFGSALQQSPFLLSGAFMQQLVQQFDTAIHPSPLLFALAVLGIIVAIRRHNALDRLLISVMIVSIGVMTFLYSTYHVYYFIHLVVPLALLAAGPIDAFERLFREPQQQSPISNVTAGKTSAVPLALVSLFFVVCFGWLVQGLRGSAAHNYGQALTVADRLRLYAPKDQRFVGIDPFYFRMTDYPLFNDFTIGSWYAARMHIDEATAWEQLAPATIAIVPSYPIPPPTVLLNYIDQHHMVLSNCWQTDELGRVDLYVQPQLAVQLTKSAAIVSPDQCQSLNSGK